MNKIRAELIRTGSVRPAPAHAVVRAAVAHGVHNDVQAARIKKALAVLQGAIDRARQAAGENHV